MNQVPPHPGHWVATRLPDGRYVMAWYTDPVCTVIRRINRARAELHTDPDPGDVAEVSRWVDAHAEPVQLVLPFPGKTAAKGRAA